MTEQPMTPRAQELYEEHRQLIAVRTDRMMAGLLALEGLAGVVVAAWWSPSAWEGAAARTSPHLVAAALLGGAIVSLPIAAGLAHPGRTATRHLVAVGQMAWGALLIHLTGGRIESHFHVFGSLAFLAFYRDWRVLVGASAFVVADHIA